MIFSGDSSKDFKVISEWVKQDSRILDLGCGDGALLKLLSKERNGRGYGVDTSIDKIMKSLDNNMLHDTDDLYRDNRIKQS